MWLIVKSDRTGSSGFNEKTTIFAQEMVDKTNVKNRENCQGKILDNGMKMCIIDVVSSEMA